MKILSAPDVRAALPMSDAIDAMREAFAAVSGGGGGADVPLRTHIDLPGDRGATLTMSAVTRSPVRLGTKLLTLFPGNPGRDLPFIQGLVVMFDEATGRPSGLLEGMTLTALRTGAASGLATDLLARPDGSRVAIIGSGTQARTQLEAMCCVRPIEQVAVYSRTPANAAGFAEEMNGRLNLLSPIHVAATAAEAADGADIICTATNAYVPVLASADVAAGAHVNAVGSFTPDMQELDMELLSRARIVVDQRSAALAEAGELIAAIDAGAVSEEGLIELGDIVSGVHAARERNDGGGGGVTVFKSVGLAVQDLCAAARALERATAENIGLSIEM